MEGSLYDGCTGRTIVFEEYADGCSLKTVAQKEITPVDFEFYMIELLKVLEQLHSHQLLHCDVKEENILICQDKTLVLIDFDLARIGLHNEMTSEDTLGTVTYAAPEQFGLGIVDERSDLYSFGKVCQNLLNKCSRLSAAQRDMWKQISLKCMEFEPQNRYQTAKDILQVVKQPAFFRAAEERGLISFEHVSTPPCVIVKAGERKTVYSYGRFGNVIMVEQCGEFYISIYHGKLEDRENNILQQMIFSRITGRLEEYDSVTEVYFLKDSLLAVRAFFHQFLLPGGGTQKAVEYYQVRQICIEDGRVLLSQLYESISGYRVLGDLEVLMDKDTLSSVYL